MTPARRKRFGRITAAVAARWIVIGGLSVLFAIFVVAIGLQAPRMTLATLLLGILITAPIGAAIVALAFYDRSLRRATHETARAEKAAQASESGFREAQVRLAAIVESSDDAILGKTLDGQITTWNRGAERMYGYTATEAIGQPVSIIVPEDRLDELSQIMNRIRRGEPIHSFETVRVRKDGRRIAASITISPIRDSSGQLTGAATIARDVTEQKELQRKLLESERWGSMGRLASFVAHEINTPLTNISLLTASIARRVQDQEVLTRLGKITAQGKIAASITAELLKFGKPGTMNVTETDLSEIVRAAVEQADVFRKPGTLSRVEVHPLACRADPLRIQEVIVNLLKNAYDATPKGAVTVTLEDRGDFAAVLVSDTGTGMPPDVQRRIFEPFFTTKKKGEGTGLGLALSKNFVVAHGGDISVSSEPGRGSTFTVLLPRNAPESAGADRPGGGRPDNGRGTRMEPRTVEASPPSI
ncbi:MAG TPA: PAS domain S-box protein [Thermoplasmata archaeon]|nr:PAS domain S-box protein [Thermoplasmata archaeon]